jgi:hypothetical protein
VSNRRETYTAALDVAVLPREARPGRHPKKDVEKALQYAEDEAKLDAEEPGKRGEAHPPLVDKCDHVGKD